MGTQKKEDKSQTDSFPCDHDIHKGLTKIYKVPGPGLQTGGARTFFERKKGGLKLFGEQKKE